VGASYSSIAACLKTAVSTPVVDPSLTSTIAWTYGTALATYVADGGTGTKFGGGPDPVGNDGGADLTYGGFLYQGLISAGSADSINNTVSGLCVGAPYDFAASRMIDFIPNVYAYTGGCALIFRLDAATITSVALTTIAPASTGVWSKITATVYPTAATQTLIASLTCSSAPTGTVLFGIDSISLTSDIYELQKK